VGIDDILNLEVVLNRLMQYIFFLPLHMTGVDDQPGLGFFARYEVAIRGDQSNNEFLHEHGHREL
jgi:hypothetical protein